MGGKRGVGEIRKQEVVNDCGSDNSADMGIGRVNGE